ncbi:MAG TPA: energy transducer TonB [Pseudomonas sabulinigri]|uniref:Protein TonB n=1 Tax=marine sediment metagenome TaxID=412755 RepID=A0A0F9VDE6_9ZZZZ|nr:energy transducer TonB [Halopseudomonas sabulinigri]HEC50656.1 energy transducer TonB [Halopseudomonas sabulinigri]
MRLFLSFLGAVLVALALFMLMVVLIMPPQDDAEMPEELLRIGVVRSVSDSASEDQTQQLQRPERPQPPEPVEEPRLDASTPQQAPQLQLQIEVPQLQSSMSLSVAPTQSNLRPAPAAPAAAPTPAPAPAAAPPPGTAEEVTPLVDVPPNYPRRALSAGIEGEVTLRFTITPDGKVENLRVTASEPPGVFEREARRAASRWRFAPRRENGNAVAREATKTLYFRLAKGKR